MMIKPKHKALLIGLVAVVAVVAMAGTIYAYVPDQTAQPSSLQSAGSNPETPMTPSDAPTETPPALPERKRASVDSAPTLPPTSMPTSMPPITSIPNISTATVDSSTVMPPQTPTPIGDLKPVPLL